MIISLARRVPHQLSAGSFVDVSGWICRTMGASSATSRTVDMYSAVLRTDYGQVSGRCTPAGSVFIGIGDSTQDYRLNPLPYGLDPHLRTVGTDREHGCIIPVYVSAKFDICIARFVGWLPSPPLPSHDTQQPESRHLHATNNRKNDRFDYEMRCEYQRLLRS